MEIDTLIKEELGDVNVFYDETGEENGLFFVEMSSGTEYDILITLAGDIDEPYGPKPGRKTRKVD